MDFIAVEWTDLTAGGQKKPQMNLETALVKAPVAGTGASSTITLKEVSVAQKGTGVVITFESPVAIKTVEAKQVNGGWSQGWRRPMFSVSTRRRPDRLLPQLRTFVRC